MLQEDIDTTTAGDRKVIYLDGNSLTTSDLMAIGQGKCVVKVVGESCYMCCNCFVYKLQISKDAEQRVQKSRNMLNAIVAKEQGCFIQT
jgi:hypothetical protein